MNFLDKIKNDDRKIVLLESENKRLKSEVDSLKKLLDAELKAKENGCHRGDYCRCCKHAVVIRDRCYCTYKQCEHFEKEFHFCDN